MSNSDGEDAMKNLTDKATYERLQKDVEAVRNDIAALGEHLSDTLNAFTSSAQKQARGSLRGSFKQARSGVDSFMDDATKKGAAALEAAQDAAATVEDTIEDAIVQRPLASVALAVGLGFLIGVTWRR